MKRTRYSLVVNLSAGLLALACSGCEPSKEQRAEWQRQRIVECENRFCDGDKEPQHDYLKSQSLKFNGNWYLGPKEYYSSGTNGAAFYWPSKTPSATSTPFPERSLVVSGHGEKVTIHIFLRGKAQWPIPNAVKPWEFRRKSSLEEARDAGDPVEQTTLRPGLERYVVHRRTSTGTNDFSVYVATARNRLMGDGHPTLFCRGDTCTSGDFPQPDIYADYRFNEANAKDWPEIHAEIGRVLGLLQPSPSSANER
jgi:hypothetical protein